MQNDTTTLDHRVLRRVRSLELFDDAELDRLATRLATRSAKPDQCIIGLGDTGEYSLYLLSGEAISRDAEGTQRKLQIECDGYLQPIAHIRPSMYEVVALSPVEYVEIPNGLLSEFSQREDEGGDDIEVEFIEQSDDANRLTIRLCQDIVSGEISLPTMPDVVHRIQTEFAGDDYDVATIGGLIQSDPAISARLLKTANSALYRGDAPIETVQQAVMRMGMDVVRNQIMIYAASALFESKSAAMKRRMQSLWKNCRKVSAFSRVLATRCERFDPETAQLAGLLCDLGIVAILDYAQKHSDLYDDEAALDQTIRALHSQINGMLLYQWNLGDEIVTVGEESHDWFRNYRNEADLCDLVLVARFYSLTGSGVVDRLPGLAKLPAFRKLELGFSAEDSLDFIAESESEVAAIESMLGAV